jgi:hypothetical protein
VCRASAANDEPRVVRLAVRNLSRINETETTAILAIAASIWAPYGIRIEVGAGADAIAVTLNPGQLTPDEELSPVLGTTLFAGGHALPFITLSLAATETLAAAAEAGVIPFRTMPRERSTRSSPGCLASHSRTSSDTICSTRRAIRPPVSSAPCCTRASWHSRSSHV